MHVVLPQVSVMVLPLLSFSPTFQRESVNALQPPWIWARYFLTVTRHMSRIFTVGQSKHSAWTNGCVFEKLRFPVFSTDFSASWREESFGRVLHSGEANAFSVVPISRTIKN